jgi:plastocyanin
MGKKTVVMVACLVGIFAVALLRANQETDSKQDCGDVRISGGIGAKEGEVHLEPETIEVEKEGCVSWLNQFGTEESKPEVMLILEDTKKCLDISGTSAEVYVGSGGKVIPIAPKDCNVTYWIPYGETSGLRFLETGTYEYVIKAQEGVAIKGKVVVR